MVFIQNSLQKWGLAGNPIYEHPGGQILKFSQKIIPNFGITPITFQFEPFDN